MTAKKITGHCEASTGWHDQGGHPVIDMCHAPARYYRNAGPFAFGVYLCDDHMGLAR